jgi:hypothetical protein
MLLSIMWKITLKFFEEKNSGFFILFCSCFQKMMPAPTAGIHEEIGISQNDINIFNESSVVLNFMENFFQILKNFFNLFSFQKTKKQKNQNLILFKKQNKLKFQKKILNP